MICPNCENPKEEGANFCRNCGYKFANDKIEDYKDSYQVNFGVSVALGLSSGLITGIFSAAFNQMVHLEWWGWTITLVFTSGAIAYLYYFSFSTLEKSAKRQLRRRKNEYEE